MELLPGLLQLAAELGHGGPQLLHLAAAFLGLRVGSVARERRGAGAGGSGRGASGGRTPSEDEEPEADDESEADEDEQCGKHGAFSGRSFSMAAACSTPPTGSCSWPFSAPSPSSLTTVTPALFATLPAGSAARVVGRVLPVLDAAGLVLGLLAVVLGATGRSGRPAVVLGAVLAALAAASLFVVTPEIASIRRATGDALATCRRPTLRDGASACSTVLSTVLFGLQAVMAVALVGLPAGPVSP